MPALPPPFSNQPVSGWISQLLQAESAEDRLRALQAIGLLAPQDESARWAAHSLRDADSTVRALAAKLLGRLSIPVSVETEADLVSLLDDADPDTRFESARALIRQETVQTDPAVRALLAFLDEEETQPLMVAAILNTLIAAGPIEGLAEADLLPRLQGRLAHERAEVREAVSTAFAKWPLLCESLVDQLLPLLDDSEPIVREKIADAFGHAGIKSEKIFAGLESASQDEDSEVARVATEALQRFGRCQQ